MNKLSLYRISCKIINIQILEVLKTYFLKNDEIICLEYLVSIPIELHTLIIIVFFSFHVL